MGGSDRARKPCRHFHAGRQLRAMIDKLDHLVATGITAIELMPLADFAGRATGAMTACCGMRPTAPMAARRPQGADRRSASARADGVSRRRLQSFRARRKLPRPLRAVVLHRRADAVGQRDRLPGAGGTRTSPSRMRCTGCANIASTGCGSTPSTPSPSRARSRCCTS